MRDIRSMPTLNTLRALSLSVALAPIALLAQNNNALTLRDAVVNPGRYMGIQRLAGLQWIPERDSVAYIKDNVLVAQGFPGGGTVDLVNLGQLQGIDPQSPPLERFPPVQWQNTRTFLVRINGAAYAYDRTNHTAQPALATPADADHAEFAPDHSKLAYTENGNLYVRVADPEDLLPVTLDATDGLVYGSSVHRDEYGVHKGTFWSPDGRYLAFYRLDERMVTPYYVEDVDTRPSTFNKFRYPMAGDSSHQVSVGIFNTSDFSTVYIKPSGALDDYRTNISWDASGRYLHVLHLDREARHLRAVRYDARTGEPVATLFEEHAERWLEPQNPLTFLKTAPERFLHLSERDGWQHLYLYTIGRPKPVQLTKGNWVVKSILGFDANEQHVFVEGTGALDPTKPTGALEHHVYKVRLANGKVERLTSGTGTHRAQLSSNGAYLLVNWSSATEPGGTHVRATANGQVVATLTSNLPAYAAVQVGSTELLHIRGEQGDVLNARLTKPAGFDPNKRYPVLVYVYNGPHGQMIHDLPHWGAQPWMLHAAERGYLVFTIDGHGMPNRGRAFEQSIHRRLGELEVKDQLHGVAWLKQQAFVDSTRIGVHGWSYGGHMTTALLLRAPGTFKIGVAGGPVMDWQMYEVMYTERYMDTPETNPEGYAATRLSDRCADLKDPLLIIHGLLDDVVLPEHSYRFLRDCVSKETPVEFFVYPGHAHNVRGKDRLHLMEKVLERMDRELGPGR